MLTLTVTNKLETQQLTHTGGPLELGRGPARDGTARVVVRDAFVSRDHVRLEELPGGKVRVVNLSTKAPVIDRQPLAAEPRHRLRIPRCRCGSGSARRSWTWSRRRRAGARQQRLQTVARPGPRRRRRHHAEPHRPQREGRRRGDRRLARNRRHRPEGGRPAGVLPAARADALVERIGLDTGHGARCARARRGGWSAGRSKDDRAPGRAFSHTILNQVLAEKRTFYVPAMAAGGGESLVGVQGVVASPVFDAKDEVIGVVYGTRAQRAQGPRDRPARSPGGATAGRRRRGRARPPRAGRRGEPAAGGEGGGRGGRPRQERVPGDGQPRTPHPADHHHRLQRDAARAGRGRQPAAVHRRPEAGPHRRPAPADAHQRHPRPLEDRGGQAGGGEGAVRPGEPDPAT